jgi:hypothetical protein
LEYGIHGHLAILEQVLKNQTLLILSSFLTIGIFLKNIILCITLKKQEFIKRSYITNKMSKEKLPKWFLIIILTIQSNHLQLKIVIEYWKDIFKGYNKFPLKKIESKFIWWSFEPIKLQKFIIWQFQDSQVSLEILWHFNVIFVIIWIIYYREKMVIGKKIGKINK